MDARGFEKVGVGRGVVPSKGPPFPKIVVMRFSFPFGPRIDCVMSCFFKESFFVFFLAKIKLVGAVSLKDNKKKRMLKVGEFGSNHNRLQKRGKREHSIFCQIKG